MLAHQPRVFRWAYHRLYSAIYPRMHKEALSRLALCIYVRVALKRPSLAALFFPWALKETDAGWMSGARTRDGIDYRNAD